MVSHQLQIALCGVCSLKLTDGILMSFSCFWRTDSSNFDNLSSMNTYKGIGRVTAIRLEEEMRINGFERERVRETERERESFLIVT